MLLALNLPETPAFLKLIDRGDLGKIERALEHEPILANAGNSDESALSKALSLDRLDIAKRLLAFGADPNIYVRKDAATTPAILSVRSKAAFDWMRKNGASLKFVGAHGESIYSLAFEMSADDFAHVVKVSQKDGIPIDFNLNGLLPLEKIAIRASRFASVSGSVAEQYRMNFEALWNALEAKGLIDARTNKNGEQSALYRFVIMNARHERLDCVSWAIQKGLRIDNRVMNADRGAKDPIRTTTTEVMGFAHAGLFEALLPVMDRLDRISLNALAQSHEDVSCAFLRRLDVEGLVDLSMLGAEKLKSLTHHAALKLQSIDDVRWVKERLCPLISLSLTALIDDLEASRRLFKNIDTDNRIEIAKAFLISFEPEAAFSSNWLDAGRLQGVMAYRHTEFPMEKTSSEWLDRLLRLHREAQMSIKRNHREAADSFEALALGAVEEGYAMPSQSSRANADAALLSRLDALHLSLASQHSNPSGIPVSAHRIRRSSGV